MTTIDYYNQNTQSFIDHTVDVDMRDTQNQFLSYLEPASWILDFGCGSGRDTKFFKESGYLVDAVDGSEELCKYASEYAGVPVKQMFFQELDAKNRYDGIWACSSILHLPYEELFLVMKKMVEAVKPDGIIYTSFKYGTFEGERNGRYFTDMTEETFAKFLESFGELRLEEQWVTSDARPGRGDEMWLNVILRKIIE